MGTSYRIRRCLCSSEQHDVKYYCTFCNEHVGKECLLRHMLYDPKTENGHNILKIRDKNTGVVHRRSCEKHPSKTTTAYCDTCTCAICHECMTQEHRSHEFILISELLKKSVCGIKDFYSILCEEVKLLENKFTERQQSIQAVKKITMKLDNKLKFLLKHSMK